MSTTRLAVERHRRGWSTRQLAAILGCSAAAVSHWENGRAAPGGVRAIAVERVFGMTVDELLTPAEEKVGSNV